MRRCARRRASLIAYTLRGKILVDQKLLMSYNLGTVKEQEQPCTAHIIVPTL